MEAENMEAENMEALAGNMEAENMEALAGNTEALAGNTEALAENMEAQNMEAMPKNMVALRDLGRKQTRILQRISDLELFLLSDQFTKSSASATEGRISAILREKGAKHFIFKRLPSDYHTWSLEALREALGADSVDHLCKCIVLVNNRVSANVTDCSNPLNSKYYVVVVQHHTQLNIENVKHFLFAHNNGKIPKRKFKLSLAPVWKLEEVTGYIFRAVTCIGMKADIPVILDDAITWLEPDFFWLEGGEIDLKLGIRTYDFIRAVKPFFAHCQ